MPLVGTICCQTGEPESFGVCEHRSRQGECDHALPLIVNMRKNAQRREGIGVSSSVLGGCPRQYVLGRTTDYYESPEDYYARWQGSFGHYAIEMDGPYPQVIQEARFYRSLLIGGEPVEISGQPDWVDMNRGLQRILIADHKFTGKKPYEPRQEHIQQLNVYKWLVEGGMLRWGDDAPNWYDWDVMGKKEVDKLEVRYYHPGKVRHTEFDVPVWTDELVEAYIRQAVFPILHAEKTGDPMSVGLYGRHNEWRASYCAFRHPCNGANCCMIPVETQ